MALTHFSPLAAAPANPSREIGCRCLASHLHTFQNCAMNIRHRDSFSFCFVGQFEYEQRARVVTRYRSPSMVNWHTASLWAACAAAPLSNLHYNSKHNRRPVLCSRREWPTKTTTKMLFTRLEDYAFAVVYFSVTFSLLFSCGCWRTRRTREKIPRWPTFT